jgi:hypothetical protein
VHPRRRSTTLLGGLDITSNLPVSRWEAVHKQPDAVPSVFSNPLSAWSQLQLLLVQHDLRRIL